jgi:hypothetical protein
LSSSVGTKAPIQVEDGDFRLNARLLEHNPVSSPPTNEKKVTHPHIYFSPKPRESQGPDTRNNRIILGRC